MPFLLLCLSIPLLIVNESNAIKMDDRDQQSREEGRQWHSFSLPAALSVPPPSAPAPQHLSLLPRLYSYSCCAVLLKLPSWPLYLRHWSAHTFVTRKVFCWPWAGTHFHANHKHVVIKTDSFSIPVTFLIMYRTFSWYTPWCDLLYMQQYFSARVDICLGGVVAECHVCGSFLKKNISLDLL